MQPASGRGGGAGRWATGWTRNSQCPPSSSVSAAATCSRHSGFYLTRLQWLIGLQDFLFFSRLLLMEEVTLGQKLLLPGISLGNVLWVSGAKFMQRYLMVPISCGVQVGCGDMEWGVGVLGCGGYIVRGLGVIGLGGGKLWPGLYVNSSTSPG